jgi:two-component system chemotaxis sensor kinase CheA
MKIAGLPANIAIDNSFAGGGWLRFVSPMAPGRSKRLQILLVEDDEADVYLIRRSLARNPRVREVVLAENGVDLIDRGGVKPDLALIDLNMPRKDGFALLRDFTTRASAQFPSVVLTSSRARADVVRCLGRGAVAFLTKSKTVGEMAAELDRLIERV